MGGIVGRAYGKKGVSPLDDLWKSYQQITFPLQLPFKAMPSFKFTIDNTSITPIEDTPQFQRAVDFAVKNPAPPPPTLPTNDEQEDFWTAARQLIQDLTYVKSKENS